MTKKQCFKCKKIKIIKEFYKCKNMADGHFNKCRSCYAAYSRTEKVLETKRKYRRNNLENFRKYNKDWYWKNRHKKMAHDKVNKAIKKGSLKKKPCEKCGRLEVEAHHYDYTKPLKVNWLCVSHHKELHRIIN